MTSFASGNSNNLIPENYIFPEIDTEEYDVKVRQYLNSMAIAVNSKENGLFNNQEVMTGQQFLPTFSIQTANNVNFREVFRMVVDFGALPNTATKSVPHGITTTQDYSFVHIYATATDPGATTITSAIPIPFATPTALANNIQIDVDATNVNITTNSAFYTAYTRCFVVLEYIKTV